MATSAVKKKQPRGPIEFLRAVAILLMMLLGGIFITVVHIILLPFLPLFDPTRHTAHALTAILVKYILRPFVRVTVEGRENLAAVKDGAAVMVCNHQSALDAFIFGDLWDHDFRVTFKSELLLYPGIGSAMWLAGYVPVTRGNKSSAHAMMAQCAKLLSKGVWVLFFPEGTRKVDGSSGPMGPFKAGAFKVAVDSGRPIVPITISGARLLMPAKGAVPFLGYGSPRLIIHPAIPSVGKTVEVLMEEARAVIASGFEDYDMLEPVAAPTAGGPAVEPKKAR